VAEAEAEAEAALSPSQMSGPRACYGCCVAVIGIVLRSDIYYLQQTRDMEVAVAPGSGTAGQSDSWVAPSEYAQVVLLPRGATAAAAAAARESQDDGISLRGGRCGRFLAADSWDVMWEELFVSLLLLCLWRIDGPRLVLAACGAELEQWAAVIVRRRRRRRSDLCWSLSLTFPYWDGSAAAAPHDTQVAQVWESL
jgi:hypothetical protein